MILESAPLDVKAGEEAAFEAAFAEAKAIIAAMPGFVSLELQRCLERRGRYLLLVRWRTLEDHTVGFRGGPLFPEWRAIVGPFFAQPPRVEHFELVGKTA